MKRLLLIGQGQIGTALSTSLASPTDESHAFELSTWTDDIDALSAGVIGSLHPDVIVNVAGKTDLAWCEANPREAVRSNIEAPWRLYRKILSYNAEAKSAIRFVHFSSGCIWDGPYDEQGQPFTPQSAPSPACLYSWTKAAADSMLLDLDPNQVAILRPRQVYSGSTTPRNTLMKLIRYPKLIDTANSMTSISVITKTVQYVTQADENWNGVWNLYDRGITTPLAVGLRLWQQGLRSKPILLAKAELDEFHVPKRVDTVLQDKRFESVIDVETIENELDSAIQKLAEGLRNNV